MDREELVGIQTIWWVDYQLAVGFLTGSWKSNMDVWISNQLFGNPTACLSWPRCNGAMLLMPGQNNSHIVDIETKQKYCCWCRNKTRAMLRCLDKAKPFVIVSDQFSRHFERNLFLIRISIGPKSDQCLALSIPLSLTPRWKSSCYKLSN